MGEYRSRTYASQLPEELQHAQHSHHNPRQSRSDRNQADRLLFELIESVAQAAKLAFHPVVSILSTNHDFQGEQASVHYSDPVPYVLAAEVALLRKFVERGAFGWIVSIHMLSAALRLA